MAYTPTAWQDDETLVNAQRMNNIESGVKMLMIISQILIIIMMTGIQN